MNLRLRIQWLGLITTLFLLFLSCIEPGERLIGLSFKELIDEPSCDTIAGRFNDTVSYPGGQAALQRFLFQNNIFNSSMDEHSIEGIVVLQLYINTEGRVYNKTIIRSVGAGIDEEALRLADLLIFNPATDSCGDSILSEYIIRVYFITGQREYRTNICATVTSMITVDEFEEAFFHNGPAGFPGGKRKMKQYFRKNLVYPDKSTDGKVKLLVLINYGGWTTGIQVIESSDSLVTDEAVRLVKSVRRWKPKIKNDKPVSGVFEIEMKFKEPDKLRF